MCDLRKLLILIQLIDNLFEELLSQPESPPTQLLGMIDSNGIEVIEFPVGSGNIWQRSNPNQSWMKK